MQPTMMRPTSLAKRWDVDASTVYRWCSEGVLPCRRVGKAVLIPLAAIEAVEKGEEKNCPGPTKAPISGSTTGRATGTSAHLRLVDDDLGAQAQEILNGLGAS